MKKTLATFLSVFSIVNIFFIPEWANILGEHSEEQFFLSPTPFANGYFAVGVTVFLVAVLLAGLIVILNKLKFEKLEAIGWLALCISFLIPLNFLREVTAVFNYYPWLSQYSHSIFGKLIFPYKLPLLAILLVGIYLLIKFYSEKIVKLTKLVGWIASPVIAVTYINLGVTYQSNRAYFSPRVRMSSSQPNQNSTKQKIVWIIFDELDYRVVFEKRPSHINLPEFDSFKKQSIFNENAYPPSDYTVHSIPSLLSGERVDVTKVQPTDLILWEPHKDLQKPWTESPSIFKEAKSLGYKSALIGWYHSYCKVFSKDVDYCRRLPAGRFGYSNTFLGSVKVILNRSLVYDKRLERAFIYNLAQIQDSALRTLAQDEFDLFFIHYSVPHKPYLFDRQSRELSPYVLREPKNYFGNLLVADRLLGEVRAQLEKINLWNNSVVIVSADHSWRKSEEYDGVRDLRVPFMIKMAGNEGLKITNTIPNLITKDFIISVMEKKIKTTLDAKNWIEGHSKNSPVGTVLIPIEKEQKKNTSHRKQIIDVDLHG